MNKNHPPQRDPETCAIEEKAAEWFGRYELGLTPAEEREFVQWLESNWRHGEAMRAMDETWDLLDRMRESERLVSLAKVERSAARQSRLRFAWPMALAAAAAIVIACAVGLKPWRESRATWLADTSAGGMKKLELADGSIVHLNAESRVEVTLRRDLRQVKLKRGEAHFVVAHDPARPFLVTAGDVAVRAVGTAFNVRHADQAIEVFVAEGKVRVETAVDGKSLLESAASSAASTPATQDAPASISAQPDLLFAGQRVSVPTVASAAPPPVVIDAMPPAEIERALSWQTRQLEFDLTPLSEVVTQFNRFNSHQLEIADAQLGRQPFGGSFRADNYAVLVELLEKHFGVVAERHADKTILRRGK